jgi:glycosyltransferase 2 family protein
MHPRHWRAWLHIARICFTPLSLLLISWLVWNSWSSINSILDDADWSRLLPSALLFLLTNALAAVTASRLFSAVGLRTDFLACLRIHCRRLPAKYLPGGIWHSVGRANDYLVLGHDSRRIGLYFVAENVILVSVTLGLGTALMAQPATPGVLQVLAT